MRKLEDDNRFLEFLQRFNSVEQIAYQLVNFGGVISLLQQELLYSIYLF